MSDNSIFIYNNEDYPFVLDQYEGPLDLLLSMIKEAKIDIKDIFVSKITDQYIEYIRTIDVLDLDKASDFVSMAATLLEIKSNDLLPKIEMLENDDFYEDEKQELQRQLEMYSLFQEASAVLKSNETTNRFYRQPEFTEKDARLVFIGATYDMLMDAFANVLHKVQTKTIEYEPRNIEKDIYTVSEKVIYISKMLFNLRKINFYDLFQEDDSRSAILNSFLALLELLKRQFCTIEQFERFGDILIIIREGAEAISLEDFVDG